MIYLVFNEGYVATSGDSLGRQDLVDESIRLGRLLVELMPDEPEARGLLALMLLTNARRRARVAPDGTLVRLPDQDRSLWDGAQVAEGQQLVRDCLLMRRPGPYQLQAAIAAVHSDAPSADLTEWGQVVALYDHLQALAPSPVVALNRAVAVAEHEGPAAGLEAVDQHELDGYYLWHAVRADLLTRLGRTDEALVELDIAITQTDNVAEQATLRSRRDLLLGG